MEVNRLLTALASIIDQFLEHQIERKFVLLNQAAQNLISSPDAQTSNLFTDSVESLKESLRGVDASPQAASIRHVLRKVGLDSLGPSALLTSVSSILTTTPFLPAQAAQSIQQLQQVVSEDMTRIRAVRTALGGLGFSGDPAFANGYEIGILMPTSVTQDDLRIVEDELSHWTYAIDVIQELAQGQPDPKIPLHTVSSGTLDLYFGFHATGAQAWAVLALGAYAILSVFRDAQAQRQRAQDIKYPQEVIDGMAAHEQNLIDKGKEETVEKLLALKSDKLPENREHELKTALKTVVAFVLKRINDGVDIEVSIPKVDDDSLAAVDNSVQGIRAEVEKLQLEMTRIVAALPDRSTPILSLPEPSADPESPNGDGTKPRRRKTPKK